MIILLWNGANLVINHRLLPGELISFFTISAFFTIPVQALINANKPLQDAIIAADRLFEITDLEKEKSERLQTDCFPEGDLVFENVHFSYGPGTIVFRGLDIRLPIGRITAVVGESGSGKSTLLSLIQKLYAPDKGTILIGEIDIQNLSTRMLRKKIASVPQHTDLFEGDFISNIALGVKEPDLDRIYEICQRLGLQSFIDQLPVRYQTIIREQGINLSGGQKQRIGIARAIYKDPQILILDEATSALDAGSEKKVLATLRWFWNQKKTIIVIAHRLSTIHQCDSIVFLKQSVDLVSEI
jgi:ABC-type bacteriocin/lantibiotic exporter with double-glycine peptidase domain